MTFVLDFDIQLRVWNAAWWGDAAEAAAGIAEDRTGNYEGSTGLAVRSHIASDLAGDMVAYGDEPYHRVPDWWALPYLAEHIVRGRAEYVR